MYLYILYILGAKEKPKGMTFQSFPKSVTVQDKESVEIECEIHGKPTNGKNTYNIHTYQKLYNITLMMFKQFEERVFKNMSYLTSFYLAGDLVNHKSNKIPSNGMLFLYIKCIFFRYIIIKHYIYSFLMLC